jgi:adenosine deaminase
MPLSFVPFAPSASEGNPSLICEVLSQGVGRDQLLRTALGEVTKEKGWSVTYLVVDAQQRGRDCFPRETMRALKSVMLHEGSPLEHHSGISRLLFIGETESLDEWEMETVECRSVKKDLEFYIRALQSAAIATYGFIPLEELSTADPESRPFTRSLLMSLARSHTGLPDPAPLGTLIKELRADVHSVLTALRARKGFEKVGSDDVRHIQRYDLLLDEIALLFQLGKRNDSLPGGPSSLLEDRRKDPEVQQTLVGGADLPDTSYMLKQHLDQALADWSMGYSFGDARDGSSSAQAELIARLHFRTKRFELLRDVGRVIGSGTISYVRECFASRSTPQREGAVAQAMPRRNGLFIIDDEIYSGLSASTVVVENLRRALRLIGLEEDTVVAPTSIILDDVHSSVGVSNGEGNLSRPPRLRNLRGESFAEPCASPDAFLAVLIDPDSTTDYIGPIRIQRLERGEEQNRWKPPILVFSKTESSGNVQQALNLGAAAYVNKEREFHLLFDIRRSLATHLASHRLDTTTASQFRALGRLKPHVAAKLLYDSGPNYIRGGAWLPGDVVMSDAREEKWIRSLPKADLHCHLGTCIPLATIKVLALNTLGYAFPTGALGLSRVMVTDVSRAVVIAESIVALNVGLHPMVALASASSALTGSGGTGVTPFGIGDAMVSRLRGKQERLGEHDVVALIVAMTEVSDATSGLPLTLSLEDHQRYFSRLEAFATPEKTVDSQEEDHSHFRVQRALSHVLDRARVHLQRIGSRWDGEFSKAEVAEFYDSHSPDGFWKDLSGRLSKRIERGYVVAEDARKEALSWLATEHGQKVHRHTIDLLRAAEFHDVLKHEGPIKAGSQLVLDSLVRVDTKVQAGHRTFSNGLQRYLWGADLLGSAHLQYPDNILLAAYALTSDNVADNVIYSEVRCETTGYTKAGMGALEATDLLRHGFDIASLFLAADQSSSRPLVRTNILLAAKRHKRERPVREVVALMQGYLERRPGRAEDQFTRLEFKQAFPRWWRPCNVVGFDVSGDEGVEPEWLKKTLEPLSFRSSPITIHAGEAADALSIWKAVYDLNATRIGHGLRLAEDVALLSYCVRQGICMELCPNSNHYTNEFTFGSDQNNVRDRYPLRLYMQRGLEVTLSTDNRYMHPPGLRTLTSEYMAAARLVGGLTRWEVLQIVKAGFKNAFLDKSEVRDLVDSVEGWIYRIVARGWV